MEPGQNLPGAISLTDYFGRVLHTLSAESSAGTPQPINLLQPPYRAQPLSGFGAYKRVFALLAAVFLAFIVVNLAQGWAMARKTKSVRAEINTLYTKTFPGEKIPANPLKALRKKLAGAGSSDRQQFLRLSSLLFQAVSKTKGVEIESLRYDARKGELSVSLRYPDFEKVEKLKQAVQQAGGRFSESGVRQSRDGLMGEAVVRAGT
ncbi:MAG TPA: hypothetical protein ENK01_03970 [Hellea balneolensis]|uniref:GspL periplasmic domain-containing protein n=1 Tax=Hellea balneolensis TaxID=287478 RepID=A0A7V5NXQ9_9PROT|nr:hypothetical protein [Hellea balneolensis]